MFRNHLINNFSLQIAVFICMLILFAPSSLKADSFPEIMLPMTEEEHSAYLGLEHGQDGFFLNEVAAETVLVQIFSMYCPICQREAEAVNELYYMIQDKGLEGQIKVIGIAPGNSAFEVSVFRDQYDIPFPLFPDPEFEWHKLLGEVGTPYFILVEIQDLGLLLTHKGAFEDPAVFLKRLSSP